MIALAIPILIVGLTLGLAWPLGRYMRWAMDPVELDPRRRAFEHLCERLLGRFATASQDWKHYVLSMLVFNLTMFVLVYVMLTTQEVYPLNPKGNVGLEPSLAFNTSASFTSNTDLQHYAGEQTLSYFSQLGGLMWLQFVAAATGIAAVTALCRGLAGRKQLGNFYQDIWRSVGLLLLPGSLIVAMLLMLTGVPMTLEGAAVAKTLEGMTQTIARGPIGDGGDQATRQQWRGLLRCQ